jgi:hypothetical protein
MTSTNVRFVVDDRDMIIDRLNNANSRIARACYDDTYGNRLESDTDLREQLLRHHLGRICGNLFYPLKPSEDGSDDAAAWVISLLIGASHLNTFPTKRSVERPSRGAPKTSKTGLQSVNSLGLFLNDVEGCYWTSTAT